MTAVGNPGTTNGIDGTPNTAMRLDDGSTFGFYSAPQWVSACPFSMTAFVKFSTPPGNQRNLVALAGGFVTAGIQVNGPTSVKAGFIGKGLTAFVDGPPILDVGWHHLVVTVSAPNPTDVTVKLYKDNALVATGSGPPDFSGITSGAITNNVPQSAAVEYVGVYNTEIDAATVAILFSGGQGRDPTLSVAAGMTGLHATARQPRPTATARQPSLTAVTIP